MKNYILYSLIFFLKILPTNAQVINGYAKVTSIAGNVLSVNNVTETGDTFEDGEYIIIMQTQADVIGANIADNASFGDLSSIASAGLYEIATIASHTEVASIPTTITVSKALTNTYSTNSNSSLQIISFRTLGTPNYTTVANIAAKTWDGNTGGVVAFNVNGILTLAHNISADATGFRGANPNLDGSAAGCSGGSNYRLATGNNFADKGEGIYKATDVNYAAGMGKILNGAGGGNSHNGGGGGGGNFSAGGAGGPGWPNCMPSAGGLGGIPLSSFFAGNRIFMGGSGGAGEGNNAGSQKGGNGGGIVLMKASEITTTGVCGINISANGEAITVGSGNDGNSGGGAGGAIVLQVTTWSIAATCPLTISANGGKGGDVTDAATHGGGGGGGMGAVIYSSAQPTINVTTNTQPGAGGSNCTACGSAGVGLGANGDGILPNVITPLPIQLLSFNAVVENEQQVRLNWITASEKNNDFFTLERSKDLLNWEEITVIDGEGNSNVLKYYVAYDYTPLNGLSYYRLKQTDFDKTFAYSNAVSVNIKNRLENVKIYPNPAKDYIIVETSQALEVNILNILGTKVYTKYIDNATKFRIDLLDFKAGVYLLQLKSSDQVQTSKIVVKD